MRGLSSFVASTCLIGTLLATPALAQLDLDTFLGSTKRFFEDLVDEPEPPAPTDQSQAGGSQAKAPQTAGPPAATREDIRTLQRQLADLGHDPGPADGIKGSRTSSAIIAFQTNRGQRVDPRITPELLREVASAWAARPTGPVAAAVADSGSSAQPPAGPSFDCRAATTTTEFAICAFPELAALDRQVATAYADAAAGAPDPQLLEQQQAWLVQRDACVNDVSCLENAMRQRLAALEAGPAPVTAAGEPPRAVQAVQLPVGLRSIAPLEHGGRLLAGFPVIHGADLADTTIDGRPYSKPSVDLALYLDLALLGAFPEIVEDVDAMARLATRFPVEELREQYFVGCRLGCSRNVPFDGWRGANEFEREASFDAFKAAIVPQLVAAAPAGPLPVRNVIEVEVMPFADDHFPLRPRRPALGLLGTYGTAVDFDLEIDGALPDTVEMDRAAAERFLAGFGSGDRYAYLALDQTLDFGGWDPRRGRPSLKLTASSARLFADPALTTLLHEFDAVRPPVEEAVEEAPPSVGVVRRELDPAVLVPRFAPDLVTSDEWERMLKAQIRADQAVFELGREAPTFFTADEVADRMVDFVVPELAPSFPARLADALSGIPETLILSASIGLSDVTFNDGKLLRTPIAGQPAGSLIAPFYPLSDRDKQRLQPLGNRHTVRMPRLVTVEMLDVPLPESLVQLGDRMVLALDRIPVIPAIDIDAATAESYWRPPCEADANALQDQGMSLEAANAESEACRHRLGTYTRAFSAAFRIRVVDVLQSEQGRVVLATLEGAELFSPHGDLLRTFEPADFAIGEDVWAAEMAEAARAQTDAEAEAAAETAAHARAEADVAATRDAVRARLAATDVAGVSLGMPLEEAERVIRDEIDVGLVLAVADDAETNSYFDARGPYAELRSFVSKDGLQQFSVFGPWTAGGHVTGVARVIVFEQAVPEAILVAQLVEKYGQPIDGHPPAGVTAWTADPGEASVFQNVPDAPGHQVFRMGNCHTTLGVRRADFMAVAEETADVSGQLTSQVAMITVHAGREKAETSNRYDYNPTVWASCGPTVLASIRSSGKGTELSYALYDLSERAANYEEPAAPQAEDFALPKL